MKDTGSMRHMSTLSAWAVAFGCAVGWDAVVMPWTTFLPKAGPLGTLLGLAVGGLVMLVIARNFHYMMNSGPATAVCTPLRPRRSDTTTAICARGSFASRTLR